MKKDQLVNTNRVPKFTLLDYNREEISERNVNKIAESMRRHKRNIIPCVVSKDGYMLEGQHRYHAFRKLKEEGASNIRFVYIISPLSYEKDSAVCRDIISTVNTESSTWKLQDWVRFHSEENDNYVKLRKLAEQYPDIKLSALAALTHSTSQVQGGSLSKTMQSGAYKYKLDGTRSYILNEVNKLIAFDSMFKEKAVIMAIIQLMRQQHFEATRLFSKINANLGGFQKQSGTSNWAGYLAKLYNKNMHKAHLKLKVTTNSY